MPQRMVYDQGDCWKGLKNGDPEALGYLYDTYADKLFEAASWITDNRETAKDALQDVFVEIWNYRHSLGEVQHTQSYLIRVLHNIICKKLKTSAFPQVEIPALYYPELNAEEKIILAETEKENTSRLDRACLHLTEKQQTIIRLRFYDGLTYKQIASKLRINYQSVNNLVFRTLLNLRRQL